MKRKIAPLILCFFCISCNSDRKLNPEEMALNYFCKELLGKKIFSTWNDKDEIVLPPFGLQERYYENGFLNDMEIYVNRQVGALSTPIVPDHFEVGEQDSLGLYTFFKQDYKLKSDIRPFRLSNVCNKLTFVENSDGTYDDNSVYIEVRHHLESPDYKIVEMVYSISEEEFSFYILLNKNGEAIGW